MRKSIIDTVASGRPEDLRKWLSLEHIARVEVSSEESTHPVEAALVDGRPTGWRAARAGEQTLRLLFDEPQQIRRIRLRFVESDVERSQEFVLRWSSDGGRTYHELVRQQWNFNPVNAWEEAEDYKVELSGVTALELRIIPDRSTGAARASLAQLRLA